MSADFETEHFKAYFREGSELVHIAGASGWTFNLTVRDWAEISKIMEAYGDSEVAEAPLAVGWSFTFERNVGIRWRDDGKGCPVWYLSAADYERAHTEADAPAPRIDWKAHSDG